MCVCLLFGWGKGGVPPLPVSLVYPTFVVRILVGIVKSIWLSSTSASFIYKIHTNTREENTWYVGFLVYLEYQSSLSVYAPLRVDKGLMKKIQKNICDKYNDGLHFAATVEILLILQ